jgi:hypothetical protein
MAASSPSGASVGEAANARSVKLGVQPYLLPLDHAERRRPVPDRVRDARAPEVVDVARAPDACSLVLAETQSPGRGLGQLGDGPRMSEPPRRLQVDEVGERRTSLVERRGVESALLAGLGLDQRRPGRLGVQPPEQLARVRSEERRELRVVGTACAAPHGRRRLVESDRGLVDARVPRHVEEPRRDRNGVAACSGREALAVPALERAAERVLDALGEGEPCRELTGDLAVHGEHPPHHRTARRQHSGGHHRTQHRRSAVAGAGPGEAGDVVEPRDVDDGELDPRPDVVAVHRGHLVRVRRASGRVHQRGVVRGGELGLGHAREPSEPDGEDRRPERVLERLAGAKICRQRERADQLDRPDAGHALGV